MANAFATTRCDIEPVERIPLIDVIDTVYVPEPPDAIPDCSSAPITPLPAEPPCAELTVGEAEVYVGLDGEGNSISEASLRFELIRGACCAWTAELELKLPSVGCPIIATDVDGKKPFTILDNSISEESGITLSVNALPNCQFEIAVDVELVDPCPKIAGMPLSGSTALPYRSGGPALVGEQRINVSRNPAVPCGFLLALDATAPRPRIVSSGGEDPSGPVNREGNDCETPGLYLTVEELAAGDFEISGEVCLPRADDTVVVYRSVPIPASDSGSASTSGGAEETPCDAPIAYDWYVVRPACGGTWTRDEGDPYGTLEEGRPLYEANNHVIPDGKYVKIEEGYVSVEDDGCLNILDYRCWYEGDPPDCDGGNSVSGSGSGNDDPLCIDVLTGIGCVDDVIVGEYTTICVTRIL